MNSLSIVHQVRPGRVARWFCYSTALVRHAASQSIQSIQASQASRDISKLTVYHKFLLSCTHNKEQRYFTTENTTVDAINDTFDGTGTGRTATPSLQTSINAVPRTTISQKKKHDKNAKLRRQRTLFVDQARLQCEGGHGGRGSLAVAMCKRKRHFRPVGGNGGHGGAVVIVADPQCTSLKMDLYYITAAAGDSGGNQACAGGTGCNAIVRVPLGVVVRRVLEYDQEWDDKNKCVVQPWSDEEQALEDDDNRNNRSFDDTHDNYDNDESLVKKEISAVQKSFEEMKESYRKQDMDFENAFNSDGTIRVKMDPKQVITLADLDQPGSHIVVARGGRGGLGTYSLASRNGPLPDGSILTKRASGQSGEVVNLELELKLIADVGLVGFPNAGKSSLLRAMSKASPDIAPYPFTTLHPLVGVLEFRDGRKIRMADIPGLIGGAAQGRGMGHDFLRHVERTKALLYMVDVAGVDFRDPVKDLSVLANELASYGDGSLMERRALVVANKVDLLHIDTVAEVLSSIREAAVKVGIQLEHDVMAISAGVTGEGLRTLSKAIRDIVMKTEQERKQLFEQESLRA